MMVLLVADGGEKVESTLRLNPGVLLVGMEDEAATVENSMTFLKKKKKKRITILLLLLSRVQLFAILWSAAYQASLSFTISQSLLKQTHVC